MIRIHDMMSHSYVNGPGRRTVIWVQGCEKRCPGCANRSSWDPDGGRPITIAELVKYIMEALPIEGITLTGGEPLLQSPALLKLVQWVKAKGLTVVTFTGYTVQEINALEDEAVRQLYELSDLVVAGPFVRSIPPMHPLTGSGNQRLICHKEAYRPYAGQVRSVASGEVRINEEGKVTLTGFLPPAAVNKITKNS
jgi:anaerobic ribonucleoside-triphosphate reductase activating protein